MRKELYKKKDIIGHRIFLVAILFLRLVGMPYLFNGYPLIVPLVGYSLAELYFNTLKLDEYPYYSLNIWHGDPWMFFFQAVMFSISLIFIHVPVEVIVGVNLLNYFIGQFVVSNVIVSIIWQLNAVVHF